MYKLAARAEISETDKQTLNSAFTHIMSNSCQIEVIFPAHRLQWISLCDYGKNSLDLKLFFFFHCLKRLLVRMGPYLCN